MQAFQAVKNFNQTDDKMLRIEDVLARVGCGKSHWYNLCKKGLAPQQIKLGPRWAVWSKKQIEFWVWCKLNGKDWQRETQTLESF